jgi:cyclopropane fatty-acyl-phospholipid synthase-like methyltransferase
MTKPYSAACERNQEPICKILGDLLANASHVLEIGSGTGQHAVFFGARMPQLQWQCSDLQQNHSGILAWQQEADLPNVLPPLTLDMAAPVWPDRTFDAVYSANTCHIMAWHQVEAMFAGASQLLPYGGVMCIYGPFNYGGNFTSPSNAGFDAALRQQAPHMGIRDFEAINALAHVHGLTLEHDHAMPANNRFLIWRRNQSSENP